MLTAMDWTRFKGGARALHYNRRDLPNLERVLSLVPGRTAVVQAGGHLGVWPKRLAREFGAVITFEPSPDLFAVLVENAPEPNIVKIQAAVGDRRGLVGLSSARRDGSKRPTHEGLTHVAGDGTIPTLRIDDLALPVCDLIALDVEGWELFALRGARNTLRRCRPVVMVEVNKNLGFVGLTPEDVRGFLIAQDYRHALTLESDEVWVPAERQQEAA